MVSYLLIEIMVGLALLGVMLRNWVEYGCGKDEIGVFGDGLVLSRVMS